MNDRAEIERLLDDLVRTRAKLAESTRLHDERDAIERKRMAVVAEAGDSTADETRPSDMPPMYGPPEWLARKGPVCNCNHPMWWHELGKGTCPRSVDDRPIRQPYDASSELNTQVGAS